MKNSLFKQANPNAGFGLKYRLKATSVHLLISLVIFVIVLAFMLLQWYPQPHFSINGGWDGVKILIFVDLIAGPLLTFVLFSPKKSKKEIKFDMALVILVQLSLLFYGIMQIHKRAPVAMVLMPEAVFRTPLAEDINDMDVFKEQFSTADEKPPVVYLRNPKTEAEKKARSAYQVISGGGPLGAYFLYEPTDAAEYAENIEALAVIGKIKLERKESNKTAIEAYEKNHPDEQFLFFPLYTDEGFAIVVMQKESKKIVDYLNIERIKVERLPID